MTTIHQIDSSLYRQSGLTSPKWLSALRTSVCVFFVASIVAPAWAQDSPSLGDVARAARAKHAVEASSERTGTPLPPVAENALVAWQIAGMPAPDMLSEIKWRGIAFLADDAHLDSLMKAHLAPEISAALPRVPSYPDTSNSSEVPEELIRASQAFNAKDYPTVRRILESLVQNNANANVYAALGNVNALSGDWSAAKNGFVQATKLDPSFLYAHIRLADVYYRLEQGSEMKIEAKTALRLQPDNAEARKYLALSAVMESHSSNASADDSAGGNSEDLSDLNGGTNQEAKALNNQAVELTARFQFPKAEPAYLRAIQLDPKVALYYYNLGNMYWKQWGISGGDKWEPAYRQAKVLAPRSLAVRQNLGYAFCKSGRYADAVNEFRELLKVDPTWNMARPCLIEALDNLGRTKEADEVEKEYEQYGGDTHDAPTGPHL